ncbi:autotransporter outer membrane beta-barrel domain-containing protein [bacterium]|nr:autotransporter outer membrane beta-barrel domain-containing protein [bacterium]
MRHSPRTLAALVLVTGLVATTAVAGDYAHERNGFMIGFGLGAGSLGIEDAGDRETSGIGDFRIGYAVRPDVVLHLESNGWTKKYTDVLLGAGDVTVTSSSAVAAVTFYPQGNGAWFRGGLGGGRAKVEVESGTVKVSDEDTGFAALFAAGYEWRLTRKFALGPHAEFTYQNLDVVGATTLFGGALDFNWYW